MLTRIHDIMWEETALLKMTLSGHERLF